MTVRSLALRWEPGHLEILDQRLLPREERWLACRSPEEMIGHIHELAVRGAPLIGVAAVCALAEFARTGAKPEAIRAAAAKLRAARPTAVNLMNSLDRMLAGELTAARLVDEAAAIAEDERVMCERMAANGAALVQAGEGILTHCNTGGLATTGAGTALAVIQKAHEQGKRIHVYVDETRPLLQGARLTAWELKRLGVPFTLICDNMAASLFAQGKIQRVFVGADRIARNGDFANKIGTYSVAVLARHHEAAFHVVAPRSTVDPECPGGAAIPIEQRKPAEVTGSHWNTGDIQVWNPAFDVTPAELVTSWVLDSGNFNREEVGKGKLCGG